MLFSEERLLIFWNTRAKEILLRPQHPERFPEHDARHWYDSEYAGWGVEKTNIPESPGDGPRGKRVAYLMPGTQHPYHLAFAEGLERIAQRAGVRLIRMTADMTREGQDAQVRRVIREKPDLAILVPISSEACTEWVRAMNAEGIPIIASNFLPNKEAYRYILAWCGPDDWGQFRLLSRKFADLMGYKGGYAILRHLPGTSCYDARTFSVITELRKAAPRMRFLAMGAADDRGQFDPKAAEARVAGWLEEFGSDLKGIVSSDDCICQEGINEALRKAGREDVVLVSAGSTQAGMRLVKEGKLHAITFQSAQADGALPMKIAIDWFNGLSIEPINYLPKYIITRDTIDDFITKKPEFSSVSLELLTRAILNGEEGEVDRFFEDAYQSFLSSEMMTPEFFRGFSIEVLSTLVHLVKMNDMDEQSLLSDYENLYKNLFNQKTPKNTMEWMKRLSLSVMRAISLERQAESQVERIVRYVNRNFSEPLSLKTLSCQFDISAPYLGRLFHKEVGKSFTTYLNELRLRKAEELLRYTTLKANEIAERTGYGAVIRKKFADPMPDFLSFDTDSLDKMEAFRFDDPWDERRFLRAGDNQIAGVGDGFARNTPAWIETVKGLHPRFPVYGSITEGHEQLWRIIGSENVLLWIGLYPDELGRFIDRVGAFLVEMTKAQIRAAGGLLDGMVIWGDVAYVNGMLFSPEFWRKHFKPIVREQIDICHAAGMPVIYHGCGRVSEIFDDFIGMGLDAYNPLEAKAGLDVVDLRRKYGHRIGFCGNMDVLAWANAPLADLRRLVLTKLNAARGGGYIFQSDHSVPSNVSAERYEYVINLVREYGTYPLRLGAYELPDVGASP